MTLIRSCEVLAVRQCGEITGFYRACDRCRNEVLRWLGSIQDDFERLTTTPATAPFSGGGKGSFGSKSPANDHVIAMLDWRSAANAVHRDDREGAPLSVPAVVGEWSEYVWRSPLCEDGRPGTVGEGLAYLRRKTDWLMQRDCASDYARDVRDLYVQLRGHAEPKRKIGECPTVIGEFRDQVVRCEAPLRASIDDDVIRCHACGSAWDRPWKELRAITAGTTQLSYKDLALWFKVPVGTLWRWRSEDDWAERGGTERRPLWCVMDVMDSYDKRRKDKTETKEAS
jgi:hypothetical protein